GPSSDRLCALGGVSRRELDNKSPPRLQCPLLVAQLRGLVLCPVRRRHISAGATADRGHRRGGGAGGAKDPLPASRVADGGCGMAMARRAAATVRATVGGR